mmetsp:Transcript_6101/g.12466  ORF Transcript_6101/g.12466 Transcript_6101/m.12466 type:complete len:197 (-) Transcript_6101:119-709(-)
MKPTAITDMSKSHEGDELIVPFQATRRQRMTESSSGHTDDSSAAAVDTNARRLMLLNVHFSSASTLAIYQLSPEEENAIKWDSAEDRQRFRCNQKLDVIRIRHKIQLCKEHHSAEDNDQMLLECLGLENLLSYKTLKRAAKRRRDHVRKVLEEQESQLALNFWDVEAISRVSESSSTLSKEMAKTLATRYWNLGNP